MTRPDAPADYDLDGPARHISWERTWADDIRDFLADMADHGDILIAGAFIGCVLTVAAAFVWGAL